MNLVIVFRPSLTYIAPFGARGFYLVEEGSCHPLKYIAPSLMFVTPR
jgi:hypothetical protein